jgi:microcystin-dependent protein
MEGTMGEIRGFAGNFAPKAWAYCEGQLISISQNSALFSLLGTTYGGDGRTTFALPDLRGRVPIQQGTGPGLSTYRLGQRGGQEIVTLTSNQMPSHTHSAIPATSGAQATITGTGTIKADSTAGTNNPDGKYPATVVDNNGDPLNAYGGTSDINMASGGVDITGTALITNIPPPTIANTGGGQYHENRQPYLTINWIICMIGLFPTRS